MGLSIAFFGSSLVSAYWNGAATYYRGIVRALHERGHRVTFYEPDAYERQQHRDIEDPSWAKVVVYAAREDQALWALERASAADLIVKASGVGVFDELLEREALRLRAPNKSVVFWDVDAPATLDRVENEPNDPFRRCIPEYDAVFTYGGGDPIVQRYRALGARTCVPIYNALDPTSHHPVPEQPRFHADLGFLGNRLPDREARVQAFFLDVAEQLPDHRLLLGGSGWGDKPLPRNVGYLGHVYTHEHNAFNCSLKAALNISRDSMASAGFSPATRVFEAAGAGACVITDAWVGIERFLEPDREVLVASDGAEVVRHVRGLSEATRLEIGRRARARMLREHTYAHRVAELERVIDARGLEMAS
jgi:spore maturation protein CgeB